MLHGRPTPIGDLYLPSKQKDPGIFSSLAHLAVQCHRLDHCIAQQRRIESFLIDRSTHDSCFLDSLHSPSDSWPSKLEFTSFPFPPPPAIVSTPRVRLDSNYSNPAELSQTNKLFLASQSAKPATADPIRTVCDATRYIRIHFLPSPVPATRDFWWPNNL